MQAAGSPSRLCHGPISLNPKGRYVAGRSAALRRLRKPELSTAHLALHPVPATSLREHWEIVSTFPETPA